MRITWLIVYACSVLCFVPDLGALTIDTYPFEEPSVNASSLVVGPEGDLWFTFSQPPRLMRVVNDEVRCVFRSGPMGSALYYVTVTPDGTVWLGSFEYTYSPEAGLREGGIELPEESLNFSLSGMGFADADCRMFVTGTSRSWVNPRDIWDIIHKVGFGISPELRFDWPTLSSILLVSARECWAFGATRGTHRLFKIDLEEGILVDEYLRSKSLQCPSAKDGDGVVWLTVGPSIGTFDVESESFSVFAEGRLLELWYRSPILAADGVVWSVEADDDLSHAETYFGISRFADGEKQTFATADGLLSNWCDSPAIDYDGSIWVLNRNPDYTPLGLSRISDGGWPPMRLMLHEVATEGTIAVEAQVINNGPVVGVDVYIAIELNGQLLYWPNWQPEPYANQINLRPGHNQTATIIEARREDVPPGSYTFWGCMTGRNTSKLIGPIDRKFETITIEVGHANQ